jgi:hypothetical protein
MKRYAVVVCENCGTEYNPSGRPVCPSEGCEQKTPSVAKPKDTLKQKSSKKAAKKAAETSDTSEE